MAPQQLAFAFPRTVQRSPDLTLLTAQLWKAPARDILRLLLFHRRRFSVRLDLKEAAIVAERRARGMPDTPTRRRLYWLIGEMLEYDDGPPLRAVEAFRRALASRTRRSPVFDAVCLRSLVVCLGRLGLMGEARRAQVCLHALVPLALPQGRRGSFLFSLGELETSDHGLFALSLADYAEASRWYEKAGLVEELARCEYERGFSLWVAGALEAAIQATLRARRLWTSIGEDDQVPNADYRLSELFSCAREGRRMLGAATRSYLGHLEDDAFYAGLSLRRRAAALHHLGRSRERDAAAVRGIWILESLAASDGWDYPRRRATVMRLETARHLLQDGRFQLAWELASGALPRLSSEELREIILPPGRGVILATLGRLREVECGEDLETALRRAAESGDAPAATGFRFIPFDSPHLYFFLGRGLVEN